MTCPQCPTSRVVDPPKVVYRDFYLPQLVEVIHPIEIINRYHCVPVPQHLYTVSVRDVFCPPLTGTAQVSSVKTARKAKAKK